MSDDQHRRTVLPLPPRRIRYGEEVDRGALSRRLRRLAADLATPSTSAPSTAPGRTYFNPFWLPATLQFHPAPSMRHAPPRTAAPVPEHSQSTGQTPSPPSQSSRHPRAPAQPRTPAVAPNAAEKLSDMERTFQWMRDGGRLPPLPSPPTHRVQDPCACAVYRSEHTQIFRLISAR
ncbi:hypothetical protein SCP_0507670 [Sparassis crispa]|uniref:Uncharacterized protein n=1 Tax=Sparassis crispa TaxID=139825 RepID=A0A401GN94_9APHY|nr:hypothetical protein SCP_0507670 [Sparassis crispa]GBE83711.1 hypothetical protein SCP_0507670 [Sparassis crispa]